MGVSVLELMIRAWSSNFYQLFARNQFHERQDVIAIVQNFLIQNSGVLEMLLIGVFIAAYGIALAIAISGVFRKLKIYIKSSCRKLFNKI